MTQALALSILGRANNRVGATEAEVLGYRRSSGLGPAALTDRERPRLDRAMQAVVRGTPAEVAARLREIAWFAGVDEVLVTGGMDDPAAQLRSDRLLVQAVLGR